MKNTQVRTERLIYREFAVAKESATITCISQGVRDRQVAGKLCSEQSGRLQVGGGWWGEVDR